MKNKKTIALAMAAATVAPMAVPAFAAEMPTVDTVYVDVTLAKSNKPGSIEEYDKLMKTKEELDNKWNAKYYQDGEHVLVNRYIFTDEKGHNIQSVEDVNKHILECQDTPGTLVLNVKDKKEGTQTVYTFKGVQTATKPIAPVVVKDSIDYRSTIAQAQIAELKKAIKEKDLDVKVTAIGNGTTATYTVVLSQKTGNKFPLAEIKIVNAPILADDNIVVLPENSDFSKHWAKDYIEGAMLDKWVVADSKFRPNDSITRAEFVRIVNNAFAIDETTVQVPRDIAHGTYFSDVKGGTWFYQDIMAAVNAGYISGYETTVKDDKGNVETVREFKPNEKITRQEAASILGRIYGMKETKDIVTKFADDKDIAVWADESVAYLNNHKVINGYADNTFRPKNNITRAESIVMLSSALKSNMPMPLK